MTRNDQDGPSRNDLLWRSSEHDRSGDSDQDDIGPLRIVAVGVIVFIVTVAVSTVILWVK